MIKSIHIRFIVLTSMLTLAVIIWYLLVLPSRHYSIYKIETPESVSGLLVDAPVEFKGVDVGKVKHLEIKNNQTVEILLEIKNTIPITKSTVALLTARGLTSRGYTGYVYVDLQEQGADHTRLAVLPGQTYPIIPSKHSSISSLDTTLSHMSQNLQELTELMHSALDKENRDLLRSLLRDLKDVTHTLSTHSLKLGSLLNNTEKITGMLANNNQRLETILINAEQASYHVEPFLKSTRDALNMLESQTLPAASQTLMNLNAVSGSVVNLIDEIKQDPSVLIRGKTPPTPGPGETR